jgi:hypothetical protein
MRRWSLLLLLCATPAFSQEEPAAAPPAATESSAPADPPASEEARPTRRRSRVKPEAPPPAEEAPTPTARETAPQAGRDAQAAIRREAHFLIDYLLTGDVRGAAGHLTYPFQLEERRFDAPEPLVATWVKELRNKRTDLVTLYDIEVLSYAELEKKYGKPPARLGAIIPRGTEVYAAVANLSGHAAVILYRQAEEGWRAFAYTD